MAMMSFLKERKSVRDFDGRNLSADDISNIQHAISEIEEDFGWDEIKLELIEDGEKVFKEFENHAGYAGVMIEAPSYISVKYANRDKMNYLKGAFVLGDMITRLLDLKLGSCVITVGDDALESKKNVFGLAGENIDYLIAVGHAKATAPYQKEVYSNRKPVEQIVFLDENFTKPANDKLRDLNMLDLFSALIHAPSYKNKQPWKFLLGQGEVFAYVENDDELQYSLTDMGIIMYYFQQMAKQMGIRGNWEIVSELVPHGDYIKLGRFKI